MAETIGLTGRLCCAKLAVSLMYSTGLPPA
jgi:hypothetical protein